MPPTIVCDWFDDRRTLSDHHLSIKRTGDCIWICLQCKGTGGGYSSGLSLEEAKQLLNDLTEALK
jgi:hypothetical protein